MKKTCANKNGSPSRAKIKDKNYRTESQIPRMNPNSSDISRLLDSDLAETSLVANRFKMSPKETLGGFQRPNDCMGW